LARRGALGVTPDTATSHLHPQALEEDPDLIRRAQEKDIPFDPVFFDGTSWSAPSYDSKGKLLPWQKYIRCELN
jgi:hypothetical protein